MTWKTRIGASARAAVALSAAILSASPAMGRDDAPGIAVPHPPKRAIGHGRPRVRSLGTLGYGPPGLHDGYQGFGLGYHPGYGYGGDALGVGIDGGHPFYGGPGYPHPAPVLRRFGPITPFPYCGGPGSPTTDRPHLFGPVGPLVHGDDVVHVEGDSPGGYGVFHGSLPYPESAFAPFSAEPASSTSPGRTRP